MPLDPLAKRLLAMMAAASTGERARPTTHERRQSLTKLMQLARSDAAVTKADGALPGPAGDIQRRPSPVGVEMVDMWKWRFL